MSGSSSGGWRQVMAPFGRERRMHARAHDYWVSLLNGQAMPALADLDPQQLADFADNSVLIDLAAAGAPPSIAFLGRQLRKEAEIGAARPDAAALPEGSLLAELLAHLPELVASRAPASLQVERRGADGAARLHRGILLPFADANGRLAAVYGVMSWWEPAAIEGMPDIAGAVTNAIRSRVAAAAPSPWCDGEPAIRLDPRPLEQQLAAARTWAALARAELAGPAAVHGAIGAAYDLMLARRAASGAEDDGQAIVEAVFGADLPPGSAALYAAVLATADRLGIGPGQLVDRLDRHSGGITGFVETIAPPAAEPQPFTLDPLTPDLLWQFGRRAAHRPSAVEEPQPRRRAAG